MIYPDRVPGVKLVTDLPMPHREGEAKLAMVNAAPESEVLREVLRRALWRYLDRDDKWTT